MVVNANLESPFSVARGATSLYIANVVVLLANTLYFLVLTNILRSTLDVGIVTALNIMIWLLVTICILAQPITVQSPIPAPLAVLKFIPEMLAKNSRTASVKIFKISLAFAGIVSGGLAVILVVSPNVAILLMGGEVLPEFVRLSAVDVFLLSLGQICLGTLIALGDMKRATSYIILWSIARYALASLLLVPYSIVGVLLGWILGDALFLIAALLTSIRDIHASSDNSGFSLYQLSRYSFYTLFSALMGFGINQADKIFALAQRGLQELAIYNVAIVAASFVGFAPYALLTILLPTLSALCASRKTKDMREMIRSYTRYVSIVVIPIAVGFASVTEVALRIFGPEYTSGFVPSVIVSLATGLTAISAIYAAVLLAIGELRWYTAANLLGLAGLFALSALLTPVLGLRGPAIGRAGLMVLTTAVYGMATKRHDLLELDSRALLSAAGSAALMGFIVFEGLSLIHSFYLKFLTLPVWVTVGVFVYVGFLRGFRLLTTGDLEFVRGMLPNRFRRLLPVIAKLAGIDL